jgi:hypothetical protein
LPLPRALRSFRRMREPEQTYGDDRAQQLRELLRTLAARIAELDARGELLAHADELIKLTGDLRSELFHYEVRATYDTPEVAESRRVVDDARAAEQRSPWEPTAWQPDEAKDGDPDRDQ